MKPHAVLIETGKRCAASGLLRESLPRGIALFFGIFALTNVLGTIKVARFNANLWWIDLRWLPEWVTNSFLILAAIVFLAFGFAQTHCPLRRRLTLFFGSALAIISLGNAANVLFLLARGQISSTVPLPLSLLVFVSMLMILRASWKEDAQQKSYRWFALAICGACAFAFPLAAMLCFGKTDYRRPADVAVALGCRVYADGRPSDALKDRVRTACRLYHEGLARKLLFSG